MSKICCSINETFLDIKMTFKDKEFMAKLLIMSTVALVCICAVSFGYCAGTSSAITTGVKKGAGSIYGILTDIVVPIGAVVIAWNGFKVWLGGERDIERAKKNILIAMCIIGLVWFSPAIATEVQNWFQSSGGAGSVFN